MVLLKNSIAKVSQLTVSAVDMRDQAPESVKKRICLKVFVSFWRGREREREKRGLGILLARGFLGLLVD